MKKSLWIVLPWVAILATVEQAGHKVEVLETYPQGDRVELGPGQEFHLPLAYSTDPVSRIFARPSLDGRQVHSNTSPSTANPGNGQNTDCSSFSDRGASAEAVRNKEERSIGKEVGLSGRSEW